MTLHVLSHKACVIETIDLLLLGLFQLRLLWDSVILGSTFHLLIVFLQGVTVNGQLIGAPAPPNGHKKHRTYFSTITILSNKPERSYLEITPRRVILDDGERLVLSCGRSAVVRSRSLEVSISAFSNITVTIRDSISFVILIHHYRKPAPHQRNHLGFYISNSKGLSSDSHGLLGRWLILRFRAVNLTKIIFLSRDRREATRQVGIKTFAFSQTTSLSSISNSPPVFFCRSSLPIPAVPGFHSFNDCSIHLLLEYTCLMPPAQRQKPNLPQELFVAPFFQMSNERRATPTFWRN